MIFVLGNSFRRRISVLCFGEPAFAIKSHGWTAGKSLESEAGNNQACFISNLFFSNKSRSCEGQMFHGHLKFSAIEHMRLRSTNFHIFHHVMGQLIAKLFTNEFFPLTRIDR